MSEYAYRVYESIVQSTSSELILFFIIAAIVSVPLYIVVLRGRKAEREHERERGQQLIEVIRGNTEAMTGLKATLDNSGDASKASFAEIVSKLNRILEMVTRMDNNHSVPP